jgi:hypothetical protein
VEFGGGGSSLQPAVLVLSAAAEDRTAKTAAALHPEKQRRHFAPAVARRSGGGDHASGLVARAGIGGELRSGEAEAVKVPSGSGGRSGNNRAGTWARLSPANLWPARPKR